MTTVENVKKNNIISDLETLDYENIKFERTTCKVPDSKDHTYERINISLNDGDELNSDLLIEVDCFSFGVSLAPNFKHNSLVSRKDLEFESYSFPISLYKDEPTEKQQKFIDSFQKLCKHIIKYVNTEHLLVDSFNVMNLEKLNPLRDGKNVIYPKLIMNRNKDKILTLFTGKNGEEIDGFKLKNMFCNCTVLLKIEYVYVSKITNEMSLVIKLREAIVEPVEEKIKPMLRR